MKKLRYRHFEGKRWIEVRVKNPQQLFDVRDPSPFRSRDLDDDFVEYIVSSAKEFPLSTSLKIVIYIEEPETGDLSKEVIKESIHTYLTYKIDLQRIELKQFLKRAQYFLLIGTILLVSCLFGAQNLNAPQTGALSVLKEGLIIFGWVSMWKPIELILFDWYPLYENLRFYKKLALTEIEIRHATV